MAFAIKAEIDDPRAEAFTFTAQKTMYGGKHAAAGDTIFLFASENDGGQGLIARGVVTSAKAVARKPGMEPVWPTRVLPAGPSSSRTPSPYPSAGATGRAISRSVSGASTSG